MKQEAILFTRDNADIVAAKLDDFNTAEMLTEEYKWMLDRYPTLVLCRDILIDRSSLLSYVVVPGMFEKNWPDITLNDKTFTFVREV